MVDVVSCARARTMCVRPRYIFIHYVRAPAGTRRQERETLYIMSHSTSRLINYSAGPPVRARVHNVVCSAGSLVFRRFFSLNIIIVSARRPPAACSRTTQKTTNPRGTSITCARRLGPAKPPSARPETPARSSCCFASVVVCPQTPQPCETTVRSAAPRLDASDGNPRRTTTA